MAEAPAANRTTGPPQPSPTDALELGGIRLTADRLLEIDGGRVMMLV